MNESHHASEAGAVPRDPVAEALVKLAAAEPVPPLEGRADELAPARRFVGPAPWLRVIREG
jgi:hypothetical protein